MYDQGLGVPKDSLLANQWLVVASGEANLENTEKDVETRRKKIIESIKNTESKENTSCSNSANTSKTSRFGVSKNIRKRTP